MGIGEVLFLRMVNPFLLPSPWWNIDPSVSVYVIVHADQLEEIDGDVLATVRQWSANFALVNGIL